MAFAVMRMRHLANKMFNFDKAPMHVYSYTKFQLSNLINSRDMMGPKIQDGVAVKVKVKVKN